LRRDDAQAGTVRAYCYYSVDTLMAQLARPVIQTRRLNNVMIAVSNLERSASFYERLFGPPVRQGDGEVDE
jgi:hypothetical protein